MGKKIGLIMLALMLCACGRSEKNKDEEISFSTGVIGYSVSEDTVEEVPDRLKDKLDGWGIPSDSYVYYFLKNEYAVEFDPVAYEDKIHEQLPEDYAFIYESDCYVSGTMEDMARQYGELFNYDLTVHMGICLSTNSQGQTCMMILFWHYSRLDNYCLEMRLVETSEGLEVLSMTNLKNGCRYYNYNDGYMYVKHTDVRGTDFYFTRVDENGDFVLISHKQKESEFEEECRNYVEQQGLDYEELISNTVADFVDTDYPMYRQFTFDIKNKHNARHRMEKKDKNPLIKV